jgi:O-phosphoseryl-tRNA(Cys) synthetase
VFNSGPGLGRIVMAMENINDIRDLYYSKDTEFSDKQIATGIKIDKKPKTLEGKNLVKIIEKGIIENRNLVGKIRKKIYSKEIKVYVSEPEEGKKLLGPGGLNEVYVYKGEILGVKPDDKRFEEILKKGVKVCSFLEAISNYFAYQIEKGKRGRLTIKYADTLPSINLKMKKEVSKYLLQNKKEIKINAPIFVDVEIE